METNTNSEARPSSAADWEQRRNCRHLCHCLTLLQSRMTSRHTGGSEAALAPLLLGRQGCNITYVVDTSENMRAVLGSVKRVLTRTLLTKASFRNSLFNIMTFSGKLTCWSHHMLPCAPDTVYMALSWIHSISCSPGRDLLPALTTALTDPDCHAIHVVCTGLPDHPEAVLTALPALAAGRCLNIFYLQDSGGQMDINTQDYLQCLMRTTRGSCYAIPVDLNGVLEKVTPLCVGENQSSVSAGSVITCCCPSTSVSLTHSTPSPLLRCSLGNPLCPVTSCVLPDQTRSPEFVPGCRVLARREVDGLYHPGTVTQQVQGRRGVWVVEFDHWGSSGLGAVCSRRQLVCSLDMVNHTTAHLRCPVPGDVVLSPWEPDLRRYGPGRVMAATEHRDGCAAGGVWGLRVLMWNSCVALVPSSLVLPVSASRHDRIVRELQITTSASARCCSWLCARSSSCPPWPLCCDCFSVAHHHLPPPSCGSDWARTDERAERVTDGRKSEHEAPSSSSSSSLSEDESRVAFPPAVKLRSKEQRPPWRYWRRTGPEPQYKQPGSAVTRRTSHPAAIDLPVPQISASPNHSSMFQSLPVAKGRRVTIRDVFRMANLKPRPPAGLRPSSGHNTTTVYT